MRFHKTALDGVVVVEPILFPDDRGFFFETYHSERFVQHGLPANFPQDNQSFSKAKVLRGLHAQREKPQGKLVRAIEGRIWDVAIDVRPGSATFGRWVAEELSDENRLQLYVPPGYLHGFCVLSETARVIYKCTDVYAPNDEIGVRWDDPELGIKWPIRDPVLSEKDLALGSLAELARQLGHG
jgi:dTDP-4-dehydrorhamnose 3,5-epimerase